MKKVLVLGSTGSIGTQALDVIEGCAELELVGLSAHRSWQELCAQAKKYCVDSVALTDREAAERVASQLGQTTNVYSGTEAVTTLIRESEADVVLNAIVGAAGLNGTVAALAEGRRLALANKESLVIGGELVMELARATGSEIIPVDSEHSALFQLLEGKQAGTVLKVTITASGGPFRGMTQEQLESVTPQMALAHPTWSMGGKITVDSATLMNKGLELIEAHHLFGFSYDQITVVVHPQSIVHGMVELIDGSTLAHLARPDMRVPISYALNYPICEEVAVESVDLITAGKLTFEEPDISTFRCLALATDAAKEGGTAPCTLNAANEIAVAAFLNGSIGFNEIASIIDQTLQQCPATVVTSFDDLFDADQKGRQAASELARAGSALS